MDYGILGPLLVRKGDQEVRLGGSKQRSVLAILLLRANELVPTARLVDELWGERPPPTAVKAVQVHVSQLRKRLGEGVLETRSTGYLLRLESADLDARRFEQLFENGRKLLAEGAAGAAMSALREGLGLWRGPPLADFRYEPFARNEIRRLEELRFAAIEQLLEAELALGRAAAAVPELEALVREHPLRESLLGLLMRALYRAGRQADALAVYQDARSALADELGLVPGQSLQRLQIAILQQDPSLDLSATETSPSRAPVPRRRPPAALEQTCASCGAANPPGAQFCHSCGGPLTIDGSVETRKIVTVLFCDIVAYSELGERLDPESMRLVVSRYVERASVVLERHGGTVERFSGDELMAVFGVPAVREDDALRAVRAAAELRECAASSEPGLGAGVLEVRIGVNTGEVLAGDPAAGHGFVSGDPVAVAKRLEQAAAPGEILLGAATFALVAHAVEAPPLELLPLQGNRREVAAFRLTSVDAEAGAIPRRDDSPLVGRTRELERLRGLYEEVAAGGAARLVLLLGEPGIGKSRLAREFVTELAGAARTLVGRCPPYGEGVTFWPLRELLHQAGRGEEALEGSSHEVFAAVRHILEELARERPLVVLFDDVHWAEPTFLDLVEYLASRLGAATVLLVCLARPELTELRPAWLQEAAAALVLEPLSENDSENMLEALGAPAPVRARIAEAAEGNPLFVEQLAAIAGEYGVDAAMPVSIRGVLHQRLDRLEREERSVLERAAVAGRSFSLEAVLELTPPEERENVNAHLLALVRKKLVRPDMVAFDEGFRFQHALIRDAAYDGIPKVVRAELHERTASRLEVEAAAGALIGYHLEQAFALRRDLGSPDVELGARAGRLLRAAAHEAFGRSDLPATISLLERALALLPPADAAELLPELGQALFEAGRFTEADDVLAEAIDRAAAAPVLEARARVERQFVLSQVNPAAGMAAAREVATVALGVFEEHRHELGQCRALCLRAWIEWAQGHTTLADEAWRRAARHARAAGQERELFEILGWRASAAVWGTTPVPNAIETCTKIRAHVRGSPVAVAVTLHPLAALHAMQGEFDEARSLIREGNAILDDVDRMHSAVSHAEALVEMLAGQPGKAEEILRSGFERLEEMGEKALLATTAALLARATYAQADFVEAERFCAVSKSMAAAEDLASQVSWRGVCAKLFARQGRAGDGEALALEAVRLVAQTDMLNRHGDALLDLAEVLRLGGRAADATERAHEAIDLFTRKGNSISAGLARTFIATPART